ncbi:MAG: DctP family TRAP transporter solute-binding subunit [Deltaproteobacteria bacterium]|nr:DctP family TRAP transporter solute-binding subunit [Deltaproteobacteria bacterium]
MRHLLMGVVATLGVSALVGILTPQEVLAEAKPFTAEYKLYTATPTDHVYSMGAQRFADLVRERTGGRIKITVFPAGQLAKGEREALEGLQQGTIDFYTGSTGPVGNFAPAFQMLDVPFLFRSYAHVDKVLDGDLGKSILSELERAQIKGLAFWENGFRNLTNSKHPVRLPADVRDLKIRTMENKVHIEAWKSLGAAPTPMTWGEVYGALQGKVIDGQENPIAVVYSSKLNEVQKYMTLTRHVYSPAIIAVGAGSWKEIPKADQDLLIKTAAEVAPYQRKLGREQETKWVGELKQRGMEIVETVDSAAWLNAIRPVFDKYAQQFGERFRKIAETR